MFQKGANIAAMLVVSRYNYLVHFCHEHIEIGVNETKCLC